MTIPARPRCGVLLAGGTSSRFDRGLKGLAPLGGRRLADWPMLALQAACDTVIIAANDPDAGSWFPGHAVVRDMGDERSAINALHTALRAAPSDSILIVCAWDMPLVTGAVLTALAHRVAAGARCCVPMHPDGRLEPLCAAYDPAVCLPALEAMLHRGERAAQGLAAAAHGVRWPIAERLSAGLTPDTFFNVNTADDLLIAADRLHFHPPPS